MKKIVFWLFAFVAMVNAAEHLDFKNVRKCSNVEGLLICSQKGYSTTGFVYAQSKNKLYYLYAGSLGTSFSVYKTSGFTIKEDLYEEEIYSFQDTDEIESFSCYKDKVIHKFLDKYGFEKRETLNGKSKDFCEDKFNKLLP